MGCLRNDYIKEGLKLGINYIIGGTVFVAPIAVSAFMDFKNGENPFQKFDGTFILMGVFGMILVVVGLLSM